MRSEETQRERALLSADSPNMAAIPTLGQAKARNQGLPQDLSHGCQGPTHWGLLLLAIGH